MAVSPPTTTLSANDSRILAALFDPETLPSSVAKSRDASAIDPTLPPLPTLSASSLASLEATQNTLIARITPSSTPTEIDAAIAEITTTITQNPTYPSAPLNRAQLYRLRLEATLPQDTSIFSLPTAETTPLFTDLSAAIALAEPPSLDAQASTYAARILRTALSHRAYLYLKAAESHAEVDGCAGPELEEKASRDFAGAARYGDEVAREMSVRTNPYAKMCGSIVREALREERKEVGLGL